MASHPARPPWLSEAAYKNILEDIATPEVHRTAVLAEVVTCADLASGKVVFDAYFSDKDLPALTFTLPPDTVFGHLFFARGFFKRIVAIVGTGDEYEIADEFAILRDATKPRRERRRVLERFERVLRGKPIRATSPMWLYLNPVKCTDASVLLDEAVDSCLPWRLALPTPQGEFVHFVFPISAVSDFRRPNCSDAGFDGLEIWRHGGETNPPAVLPVACTSLGGLQEVVASSANYDQKLAPIGFCSSAVLP